MLDRAGVIVSVNSAWDAFSGADGGDPARVGVGVSYLEVCAASGGEPVAERVAAAIRTALPGDLPALMTVEVPCHSPDTSRWLDTLIPCLAVGVGLPSPGYRNGGARRGRPSARGRTAAFRGDHGQACKSDKRTEQLCQPNSAAALSGWPTTIRATTRRHHCRTVFDHLPNPRRLPETNSDRVTQIAGCMMTRG